MMMKFDLLLVCFLVGCTLNVVVKAGDEEELADCGDPRCVEVETSPVGASDECGVICADEDACDGAQCLIEQAANDNICGLGAACLRPAYQIALTQGRDPCGCSTSEAASNIAECFSSMATAQVEHKGKTFVKELEVGDRVLTGRNKYQPVYTVDHKDPNKLSKFVQIYSTGAANEDSPLELTSSHMVFVIGKDGPIPASAVKVGDSLQTVDDSSPVIVTKVSTIQREGIWNPITSDGTIVVDGIVASTYSMPFRKNDEAKLEVAGVTMMSYHDFLHFLMTPYRAICLGVSLSFCEAKGELNGYSELGMSISKFVFAQNELVQDAMIFVFVQIALVFKFLSNPLVSIGMVLGTGSFVYFSRKK